MSKLFKTCFLFSCLYYLYQLGNTKSTLNWNWSHCSTKEPQWTGRISLPINLLNIFCFLSECTDDFWRGENVSLSLNLKGNGKTMLLRTRHISIQLEPSLNEIENLGRIHNQFFVIISSQCTWQARCHHSKSIQSFSNNEHPDQTWTFVCHLLTFFFFFFYVWP